MPSGGPGNDRHARGAKDDRALTWKVGDGTEADQVAAQQIELHCE